jgi:hypothetical protein
LGEDLWWAVQWLEMKKAGVLTAQASKD